MSQDGSKAPALKCSFCGKEAVYRRRYSGETLCSSCFKHSLVEKTRRTVSRYQLLKHGERVAVALSGGKDSASLLHVLKQLTPEHGSTLFAVTVDEGVQGYRDESKMLAEKVCRELEVPQTVVSFDELFGFTLDEALSREGRRTTSCTVCGTLRRRAIDLAAQRIGADVVATAHNLDDFLQTFLINLMNNDLQRLAWLNPLHLQAGGEGLRRVKPFMEVYEEEIAYYAYLSGLEFQSSECPYRSESVRSEIRVFLDRLEKEHSGVKYGMFGSVMQLIEGVQGLPQKERRVCERCGQLSSQPVCSVCKTLKLVGGNI